MFSYAVDKQLINDVEYYNFLLTELSKVEIAKNSELGSKEYWLKNIKDEKNKNDASAYYIELLQKHVHQAEQTLLRLDTRYCEIKKQIAKYEPLKREYDRQVESKNKWREFKSGILNMFGMFVIPFGLFGWFVWYPIRDHKRCMKLIAEGKMTQEEYDAIQEEKLEEMQERWSKQSSNPATGLPMHSSGLDAGGNPRGCSSDYGRRYHRY